MFNFMANKWTIKQEPIIDGGISDVQPATIETQKLVNLVRQAAEDKAGQKFDMFLATLFKSQVVTGMNYFVKVDVGGGKFVHLRVYEPLSFIGEPPKLIGIQLNKTAADEITYF